MTDQATRVVQAGWYQDPAVSEQVRWWNGLAWTEHVREKPTVVAAPASVVVSTSVSAAETTEERIAAARVLERQFGISTSENEIITSATALGYGTAASTASAASSGAGTEIVRTAQPQPQTVNPAVRQAEEGRRTGQAAPLRRPSRSATGAAWLVALTPLLALLFGAAAAYVYLYLSPVLFAFAIALALPYLLGILWALGDSRALRARDMPAPSPAWALLGGIGYLIARRVRVKGSGPLVMFLVFAALIAAVPVALVGTGQLRPLETALTIQKTISQDYVSSGRAASISCPTFVDASTPGTLYTCTATLGTGVTRSVWVSIDSTDGAFSYAMVR